MSDDAKPMTTADVEAWRVNLGQHWAAGIGPLGHEVVIDGDRILATTRALEMVTAQRDEKHGYFQELCDVLRVSSGAAAVHSARELVRRWEAETARAEKAEAERDAARARVAVLETALLDACREKVVHGHTTTLLVSATRLEIPGIKRLCVDADRIRSEAKTLVAELVTALEGVINPAEDVASELRAVDSFGCDALIPALYGSIATARAAMAKAKGGA